MLFVPAPPSWRRRDPLRRRHRPLRRLHPAGEEWDGYQDGASGGRFGEGVTRSLLMTRTIINQRHAILICSIRDRLAAKILQPVTWIRGLPHPHRQDRRQKDK